MLPAALAIALLGGIESLLSAVVADAMTGRRHRSNCELVAQGVANIGCGAVRRPVRDRHDRPHRDERPRRRDRAGLRHAACAFPPALHAGRGAARLLHPAGGARRQSSPSSPANMAERHEFVAILTPLARRGLRPPRDLPPDGLPGPDRRHRRRGRARQLPVHAPHGAARRGRGRAPARRRGRGRRRRRTPGLRGPRGRRPGVMVYRIAGPLFFGASSTIATVLERIGQFPEDGDPRSVGRAVRRTRRPRPRSRSSRERAPGTASQVYVPGASRPVRRVLLRQGLRRPLVRYAPSVADARMAAAHTGSAGEGGKVYAPTQT